MAWQRTIRYTPAVTIVAATAEIARSQIWQWIHHDKGVLADGRPVTESLYLQLLDDELKKLPAGSLQANLAWRTFLLQPGRLWRRCAWRALECAVDAGGVVGAAAATTRRQCGTS
jgi:hypothetical protein